MTGRAFECFDTLSLIPGSFIPSDEHQGFYGKYTSNATATHSSVWTKCLQASISVSLPPAWMTYSKHSPSKIKRNGRWKGKSFLSFKASEMSTLQGESEKSIKIRQICTLFDPFQFFSLYYHLGVFVSDSLKEKGTWFSIWNTKWLIQQLLYPFRAL